MSDTSAESVFLTWLEAAFPDARLCTETPANLDTLVNADTNVIRVFCIGGQGESVSTFNNPTMDFNVYGKDRGTARAFAYAVRDKLRTQMPGSVVNGVFVARVNPGNEPVWTPYDDTNIRRFTYTTTARLQTLQGAS